MSGVDCCRSFPMTLRSAKLLAEASSDFICDTLGLIRNPA